MTFRLMSPQPPIVVEPGEIDWAVDQLEAVLRELGAR